MMGNQWQKQVEIMKKTLVTVWLLAILRYISGCIGPVPTDEPAQCDITPITEILNSSRRGIQLNVQTEMDAAGRPFQTINLLFGSTEYNPGSTGLVLVINGVPQVSTTWNDRMVGLGRPVQISRDQVQHNLCANTASFWEVAVGFGTIGEDAHGSTDPGFSVVGHPLREGQEIQVRLDVCRGDRCIPGVSRTFRVHLVP
jgi:hypothetical protein